MAINCSVEEREKQYDALLMDHFRNGMRKKIEEILASIALATKSKFKQQQQQQIRSTRRRIGKTSCIYAHTNKNTTNERVYQQ